MNVRRRSSGVDAERPTPHFCPFRGGRIETMPDHSEWPGVLRAGLESPTSERKGWQSALAPQFIALFLWVAFFDQIPLEATAPGGVGWPVLGSAVAGLLCYALLYRSPALWGAATGRPLSVVATSTFGVRGATWVPGLLQAICAVVWLSVATHYATSLCLRGLERIQLLDPRYLQPLNAGRGATPGLLYLITALFWCYAAAFVGRYLVRVIAALMNVFPILPALLMGVSTLLALNALRVPDPAAGFRSNPAAGMNAGPTAALVVVHMVFGFFATSGLSAADWGAAVRGEKDVRIGGWVGVALASWVVSTLAILTAAGAAAKVGASAAMRYTSALEILARSKPAGVMLLTFGLAALAPACYAAFVFSVRLHEIWPRVRRTHWTVLGSGAAWLILSAGLVVRTLDVFTVVGGVVAPAAGALSADYVRSRGVWPGPRVGYNLPGLVAWFVGSLVGLAPLLGSMLGVVRLTNLQPAAVLAYLTAFVVYLAAAGLGAESAPETRLVRQAGELPPGKKS